MVKNKVNSKYIPLIFAGLFFSYLFRGVYSMYLSFSTLEDLRTANIILQAIYALFEYGAIPALLCYFLSSIVYSIGFRHGARVMTRSDFTAQVCGVAALVNVLTGVVDVFSIIAPLTDIIVCTAEPLILTVSFILYFNLRMVRKYDMNPAQRFLGFRSYFMWLMIFQGIEVALADGIYFLVARAGLEAQLASEYGIIITRGAEILAVIDVCIFFASVIAVLIIAYVLKAKAADFVDKVAPPPEENGKVKDPDIFIIDGEEKNIREEIAKIFNDNPGKEDGGSDDHHDDINDIFDL